MVRDGAIHRERRARLVAFMRRAYRCATPNARRDGAGRGETGSAAGALHSSLLRLAFSLSRAASDAADRKSLRKSSPV